MGCITISVIGTRSTLIYNDNECESKKQTLNSWHLLTWAILIFMISDHRQVLFGKKIFFSLNVIFLSNAICMFNTVDFRQLKLTQKTYLFMDTLVKCFFSNFIQILHRVDIFGNERSDMNIEQLKLYASSQHTRVVNFF